MNWYKLNRVLHRDLGYLFFGMTIIYALSGIALNHLKDWNPSYIIDRDVYKITNEYSKNNFDDNTAKSILNNFDIENRYKSYYFPTQKDVTIFFEDGSLIIDLSDNTAVYESITRRPIFYEVNLLHYNPGWAWKWFSDAFAVILIIISVTGLFMIKGKKGIKGRGAWMTALGLIVPLVFLLFYL